MNRAFRPFLMVLFSSVLLFSGCAKKEWDILSEKDRATLDKILAHWETWVPARKKEGSAPLMTFVELYQGLDAEEQAFLDRVRAIKPSTAEIEKSVSFKRIDDEYVVKNGERVKLDTQYLPQKVYGMYQLLMQAMQKDLGKRLFVDSGYRAPAYQLYTFLFYTPKHHYSLKETRDWVALPGHSEHGNPATQAIDFINETGENGDNAPEDFEKLPEYAWLLKNANHYGFELSYPRGTVGTTFEPWHWRICSGDCGKNQPQTPIA